MSPSAGSAFADDARLRWHPSASGLATLHGEGKLTVMPAIGYTGANQSHFTSRHYWEVGETNPYGRWGWLGRFLDRHGAADNPLQGADARLRPRSPRWRPSSVPVATVASPTATTSAAPGVCDPVTGQMLDAFGDLGELTTDRRQPRVRAAGRGHDRPPARAAPAVPERVHHARWAYPAGTTSRGASRRWRR